MKNDNSYRRREEVRLPFEELETDFVQGDELYKAVVCSLASMPDYSLYITDNSYEINGVREDSGFSRLLSSHSGPSITTEIEETGKYSHLTVDLSAQNKPEINVLYADIASLEKALEDYFDPTEKFGQDYTVNPSGNFGLNAIASYISRL